MRRSAAALVEKIRHPAWRWHRRIDHGPAARLLLSSAMIARLPPSPPCDRHQYSYATHATRCPAGESILSPRATQPPPPDPHTTRGGTSTIIITINIIYIYVRRVEGLPPPPPPVRANSFLAAPGDLVGGGGGGGEERAQWKSTDLGRRRCRRHHHRVIYLAVVPIPRTLPAAQTTWAASTSSRCAPRWDFDLVAFHVLPPPFFIHYYYSIHPLCYTRHRLFSRIFNIILQIILYMLSEATGGIQSTR